MNAVHNLIAAGFGNAVRPCAPPGVALSPYSTIDPDQVGKIPMQPGPHGWTGFTGWTGEVEPQPDTWASWHPDIGAGVVTRNHPTIDADILDERAAAVVEGLVYERFGHGLLKRVGLAPKAAFIGRLEGEPFPKTAITFTLPGGSHEHVIEVLGNGQYVNLDAIHPKTGRRYELDPPIEEVVASELAPISKAGIEGFLAECRAVLSESLGAVFDDQGAAASQGQGAARQEVRNRLEHDPVVQILKKRGEFLRRRRDGGVDVLCPWRHEHSSTDKGTASTYWPAYTGGFASPAYVCKHAHCTHRGWPEFKEAIGYQEPKIQIHAGEGDFNGDVLGLFEELLLTEEDVSKMADAEFLVPDMIVRGHMAGYMAAANAGKTTIFIALCEELRALGLTVLYVNADAPPDALKSHFAHAKQHGYAVLAPDAKVGMGTEDVRKRLEKLKAADCDLSNHVFIFDTVKKFADMIDKTAQKELYKLLRGLSAKGATICLLGHVNKYPGPNGKPVFEGTADVRNDLDELIYLDASHDTENGKINITTRPDKVRALIQPVSFQIDVSTRSVTRLDRLIQIITDDDRAMVMAIIEAIQAGDVNQEAITAKASESSAFSKKKVRATLYRFSEGDSPLWTVRRGGEKNALIYTLTVHGERWVK